MDMVVWAVISSLISVIACPVIADRKGRSVVGWLFGGLCLGLLGVIIVACLRNLND